VSITAASNYIRLYWRRSAKGGLRVARGSVSAAFGDFYSISWCIIVYHCVS
jgi:hypothetical protein